MSSENQFDNKDNRIENLEELLGSALDGGGRSGRMKDKGQAEELGATGKDTLEQKITEPEMVEREVPEQKIPEQEESQESQEAPEKVKKKKKTKEEKKAEKAKKKGKKKRSSKPLIVAVCVVMVMVLALGGVIGAGLTVVHTKAKKITQVQVNREALGIDSRVAKELKNYRNIALLGIDARDMDDDSNTRSDAMIIASINKSTSEVKLVSLYRDTYVSLGDNFGLDKMTHAYFYGKATQTMQTINRNLDLNCQEVVVVNWKSVADTVDALGGLEIDVKESEIKEMNKYIKDTQKNIGGSKKRIKKAGKQTLNGIQAVTYARIRKDSADGDHRRNERMKIVLSAAFDKAKTLSLSELNAIADEILPGIKTNLTPNQLTEIVTKLNAYKITDSVNWPYTAGEKIINNIWYGPPVTLKSNVVRLHKEFFGQENYNPTDTVKTISDNISSTTGMW